MKTADLPDAAVKIKASKTFDLAAGCSCDNSVIIDESVYTDMLTEFKKIGAHLLNSEEKERLKKAIWPEWPANHIINRDIVASPISNIAKLAGLDVPEGTCLLLVEEDQTGEASPFSGEKMSLVTTVYKSKSIDEAIRITNENHAYSGSGHSCGIFSAAPENIEKLALNTYTTRVVVNQPQAATNGAAGERHALHPFTGLRNLGRQWNFREHRTETLSEQHLGDSGNTQLQTHRRRVVFRVYTPELDTCSIGKVKTA
jgi:sulfoacetaldehyde dehydrogenase